MRQEKLFFVVFGFQAPEVGPTQKKLLRACPLPATTTQYNWYLSKNRFEKFTRHPRDAIPVQTRIHFTQRCATLYSESFLRIRCTHNQVGSEFAKIRPLSNYQIIFNKL